MDPERLAKQPLFAALSKKERAELARVADEVDIREGEHLLDEGRFAHEFIVIEEGEAEVVHDGERLADLGPGDFLGELGAQNDSVRNASVIAKGPMTVIVMTARDFRRMMRTYPSVHTMVEAAMADRKRSVTLG